MTKSFTKEVSYTYSNLKCSVLRKTNELKSLLTVYIHELICQPVLKAFKFSSMMEGEKKAQSDSIVLSTPPVSSSTELRVR